MLKVTDWIRLECLLRCKMNSSAILSRNPQAIESELTGKHCQTEGANLCRTEKWLLTARIRLVSPELWMVEKEDELVVVWQQNECLLNFLWKRSFSAKDRTVQLTSSLRQSTFMFVFFWSDIWLCNFLWGLTSTISPLRHSLLIVNKCVILCPAWNTWFLHSYN